MVVPPFMFCDGRSASCECAATSSETIEFRAAASETDSPRLQRASYHKGWREGRSGSVVEVV